MSSIARASARAGGYAPIADYGAIGDGRTVALVGRDGSIDWMPIPDLESPPVFGAILDRRRGGYFTVHPAEAYTAVRRYVPDTNVLETTFETACGAVRITDAVTRTPAFVMPWVEVARRIEGLHGEVRIEWEVVPRFEYSKHPSRAVGGSIPVFASDGVSVAVGSFGAGEPVVLEDRARGGAVIRRGDRALLAVAGLREEPVPVIEREGVERRIDETIRYWQSWCTRIRYDGPWTDAVRRSALALALLMYSPTGAICAAPTTSLPERIGGQRNWDYRFIWLRDSSFAMEALLEIGLIEEAHAILRSLVGAISRTHPRLPVFYAYDGSIPRGERELDLEGYRCSAPVRVGNAASPQLQLGSYGDVLDGVWQYMRCGGSVTAEPARVIHDVASFVCRIWKNADCGIWELRDIRQHFTSSKVGAWAALERALELQRMHIVDEAGAFAWSRARDDIAAFVHERCWSERKQSYTFYAGTDDLDASVLLMTRFGFMRGDEARMRSTIRAIRSELGSGPAVYRYSDVRAREGAFVACSFWLASSLVRTGHVDDAAEILDASASMSNDLGLMAEEFDPSTRELLGNFPQALSHLTFINAAIDVASARSTARVRERSTM